MYIFAVLWVVPAAAGQYTAEQRRLDLESFDQIWTTIKENHWDPELGGIDWQGIRQELRPQVERADSSRAARRLMQEMLDRLGQSHFLILFGELLPADLEGAPAGTTPVGGDGETGLDLRRIDGEAVVRTVVNGSPAAIAGITPGWVVDTVQGQPLEPLLSSSPGFGPGQELLIMAAVRSRLQGPVGQTVSLRLLDRNNTMRLFELELAMARGKRVQVGYLPPMSVWLEWQMLAAGDGQRIGYIRFSSFFDPGQLMARFAEAMRVFIDQQVSGVVIDIRGNPGGIGAMAMGMAGWFVGDKGQKLGTMHTRYGALSFAVFPRPQIYHGPLAILVDGLSASTSEILADGLQQLGRARIFGSPTAGMALPSRIMGLANGDALQYAFANYRSANGHSLEGRGVLPDEVVAMTREALLAGQDQVLQAARQWVIDRHWPRQAFTEEAGSR